MKNINFILYLFSQKNLNFGCAKAPRSNNLKRCRTSQYDRLLRLLHRGSFRISPNQIFLGGLVLLLFFCCSCGKSKKDNSFEAAYIYRNEADSFYQSQIAPSPPLPVYPWSGRYLGSYFRITKEFFRCKGASDHPILVEKGVLSDCSGRHSLPLKEGDEHIYPLLIDLLNYLQECTGKQVVVTTGHRCSKHNQYADQSSYNRASKHMIGAEVDFYVLGLEERPLEVVKLIQQYYQGEPKEYSEFARYTKSEVNVREAPWHNKEIFIKLYQADEGRDFDNQHGYPYLSVQVRYDRERGAPLRFTWEEAEKILHEN